MQQQLTQIRSAWSGFPRRAQLAIAGVAVVTVIVLFLVLRAATSTTWVPVTAAGMTPDKLGQAQTALDEAGFASQLNSTSTAVEVAEADSAKAQGVLATAGIAAKGNRVECAKQFSENSMTGGTSDRFKVQLQNCEENQAANAIENIEGVSKASVAVSLPGKELFAEDQGTAKASVTVDTDGAELPKKAVLGIQETVAARFEGMTRENVSIIDDSGTSLTSSSGDESADTQMKKLEIEDKYNTLVQTKIGNALDDIVGKGNYSVISNAELDMDQITRGVTEYTPSGKDGDSLVSVEDYEKELLNGVGSTDVQGVAGVATNTGTAATTGAADNDTRIVTDDLSGTGTAGDGGYIKNKNNLQYANNRVEERINVAPGTVIRNRVSVNVDDSVSADTANAAKDTVAAYMGGNTPDSFSFHRVALAISETNTAGATSGSSTSPISGYVKWALLGLGLIGLAFVLRRALTQRTAELLAPASDLLLLDAGDFTPIPIAELEAALAAAQPDVERNVRLELQRKVEQIAEAKPQDVANELRRWMHQEDVTYAAPRRS
ncbi:MAG: fliF [Thermoleophilia bacterium]|nr:fliF [Thermoleophilia bacterium]